MPKTPPRESVIQQVVEHLRVTSSFIVLSENHEGKVQLLTYPQDPDEETRERAAAKSLAEYALMIGGKWRQRHAMDSEENARDAGRYGLPGVEE